MKEVQLNIFIKGVADKFKTEFLIFGPDMLHHDKRSLNILYDRQSLCSEAIYRNADTQTRQDYYSYFYLNIFAKSNPKDIKSTVIIA
jgi:hypothetical protein